MSSLFDMHLYLDGDPALGDPKTLRGGTDQG